MFSGVPCADAVTESSLGEGGGIYPDVLGSGQ